MRISPLLLSALTLVSNCALAEENKDASITINYFDDLKGKEPVVGSEWKIFKVADIVNKVEDNHVNGETIVSLVKGIEFTGETTVEQVLEKFDQKINNESSRYISDVLKDGKKLECHTAKTDKNGKIVFDNLSYGIYLGVESEAIEYHTLSDSFLVSLPFTDGPTYELDREINPKPQLAGHLEIQEITPMGNKDLVWHMDLKKFPEGTYKCQFADGTMGTIQAKGTIAFKDKQVAKIFNIPAEQNYLIHEVEEFTDGYQTVYLNHMNKIIAKDTQKVVIKNWKTTSTGELGQNPWFYGGLVAAGVAIAGIAFFMNKKKKEDKE